MPVKVSVVVPVWNPGGDIDRCIASLLGQSLPPGEVESIFVDDGSTDDTPARLDALAAAHPNVRVVHIPNSGWPGRPRNVGVANAVGEYVQFVDQDDHLAPEALERLYAYGRANSADIVIGRVASDFRGVALSVFARDRPSCSIHDAPLIDSLTPHKMFRRAFLQAKDLAFPEGKRRLEDQLFMVQAYFRAASVAILADYPCYFYLERSDKRNAGATLIVPDQYFANLREVLAEVIANTEPGEERARVLRRFCRVEILARLSEPTFPGQDDAYRRELFAAARAVLVEFMGPDVDAQLGGVRRLRSQLVREGQYDEVLGLARRAARLRAACRITSCVWDRDRLIVGFKVGIERDDGTPFHLVRRRDRYVLGPEITDASSARSIDVTDEVEKVRATIWVRDRTTSVEWQAPTKTQVVLEAGDADPVGSVPVIPSLAGTVVLGPQQLALGSPLADARWDVWLRVVAFGLDLRTRLGGEWVPVTRRTRIPVLVGLPPRLVVPSLARGLHGGPGLDLSSDGAGTVRRQTDPPSDDGLGLRLDITTVDLPTRRRSVEVRSADDADPAGVPLGTIRRDLAGRVYFEEVGVGRRTRLGRAVRRYGRAGWRRVPSPIQAPIRSTWGRVRRP
jgi:poly(ribitol-phosphate) beta-N-acetylglucosaminyltransferase